MDTDFINKYLEKLSSNMNSVTNQFIMLEARYELLQEQNNVLQEEVAKLQKAAARKRK
jgi:flagellar capping protein FliD